MRGLDRLLSNIIGEVDLAFCIDGKYPDYPGADDLSVDGSREVVLSYDNTVLVDLPASEFQKRSKYIELCAKHKIDYLIILDTDEYPEQETANWPLFRENLVRNAEIKHYHQYNVYAILIQVNSPYYQPTVPYKPYQTWINDNIVGREFGYYPRVWYRPEMMKYNKGTHYLFCHKDPSTKLGKMETNPAIEIIEGVRFLHDHIYRTDRHQNSRRDYQLNYLVPHEQKITSTWWLYYSWNGINATAPSQPLQ